jgi:hypothetical protein
VEVLVMTRPAWLLGFLLVSLVLGSVSFSTPRSQSDSGVPVSDEEYEIYAAAITQKYVQANTKLLVIEDRTFRYDFAVENDEPWRDKPKGLNISPSAVEDYETRNSQKWLLNKASFKLPVKLTLITDLDLRAIFHGKWGELEWIAYYRKYPDSSGFVMLSRIGFNSEHTQALLYIGSRCGPGCGDLHFLFLEKANGTWTTKKELRKKNF